MLPFRFLTSLTCSCVHLSPTPSKRQGEPRRQTVHSDVRSHHSSYSLLGDSKFTGPHSCCHFLPFIFCFTDEEDSLLFYASNWKLIRSLENQSQSKKKSFFTVVWVYINTKLRCWNAVTAYPKGLLCIDTVFAFCRWNYVFCQSCGAELIVIFYT